MLFTIDYFGEKKTICDECLEKLEDSYGDTFTIIHDENNNFSVSESECAFYIVPRCESKY